MRLHNLQSDPDSLGVELDCGENDDLTLPLIFQCLISEFRWLGLIFVQHFESSIFGQAVLLSEANQKSISTST